MTVVDPSQSSENIFKDTSAALNCSIFRHCAIVIEEWYIQRLPRVMQETT
jgi:hypothetical protein